MRSFLPVELRAPVGRLIAFVAFVLCCVGASFDLARVATERSWQLLQAVANEVRSELRNGYGGHGTSSSGQTHLTIS